METFFYLTKSGNGGGSPPVAPTPVSTRPRVLIKTAQSNGRGQQASSSIATIYPQLLGIQPNRFIWNGSAFVNMEVDVNLNWPAPNVYFGAELNYAYLINNFWQNNYFDYVIKIAWNATEINEWLVGGSHRDTFITWVNNALAAISGNSNNYSAVMYFDQGENDANQGQAIAEMYEGKFTQMAADFRANLNVRQLPIILRKHRFDVVGFPYIAEIINQQNNIIANVSDTYILSGDDLTLFDGIHFDGESQCILGNRLMQEAIYLFD